MSAGAGAKVRPKKLETEEVDAIGWRLALVEGGEMFAVWLSVEC